MLPTLPPDSTADEARTLLTAAGWQEIGTGDWAWVLASPDGRLAARVTPFDPACRLFAEACLAGPPHPYLVRVDARAPLRHKGYVVVMERLYPAAPDRADRLVADLGVTGPSLGAGSHPSTDAAVDPELADLRRRIDALLTAGADRFTLWGGADIRQGNILQTADGRLQLTDPVFINGLHIVQAIQEGRVDRLRDFSRSDLEGFLSIPAVAAAPEADELRRQAAALVLDPTTTTTTHGGDHALDS